MRIGILLRINYNVDDDDDDDNNNNNQSRNCTRICIYIRTEYIKDEESK